MGLGRWSFENRREKIQSCISLTSGNLHLSKMCHYQPWEEHSPEHEFLTIERNILDQLETLLEVRLATMEARLARIELQVENMEARLMFVQKALQCLCTLSILIIAYVICNA
ncbi:hypothetical protein LWI29_001577 [Acer saccharum]|uniref:Uncharacterized protein n=1 Tax=Acer saccharum TaxID=4024 RepID=A0AA39RLE2_ACESA|nr:hypothetical protein LWI29_001577 [Acer saccharum]